MHLSKLLRESRIAHLARPLDAKRLKNLVFMYSAPERVFLLHEHRVKNLKHSFQTLCAGMILWFYLHYHIAVVARRRSFMIACSSL